MLAIDLFSGAGGASEGLKQAGFRPIAAVELDADAAASFRSNHRDCHVYQFDVRQLAPEEFKDTLRKEDLALLTACPPCQGFSTLGTTSVEDERNDLVNEVWRFARVLRPRALLMENVPGLRYDQRFARLLRSLRGAGYATWYDLVDASDFRVPQRRRRLVLIAAIGRRGRPLGDALRWVPHQSRGTLTVGQALARLKKQRLKRDPVQKGRRHSDEVVERITHIPEGGSRFDLPERLQLECHKRLGMRSAMGPYGRMSRSEPAPTLTTRCTTPSCGPFVHPTEDRGVTLREAAVLQSFPPNYRFVGDYGSVERQIGNAVPVALARALGHAVRRILSETRHDS